MGLQQITNTKLRKYRIKKRMCPLQNDTSSFIKTDIILFQDARNYRYLVLQAEQFEFSNADILTIPFTQRYISQVNIAIFRLQESNSDSRITSIKFFGLK